MAKAKVKPADLDYIEEQTAPVPEAQPEAQPESITLTDLQLMLQILDLASSRGAFRGAELTQVGAVFDKLNRFLSYVAEQQKKAQEASAAELQE